MKRLYYLHPDNKEPVDAGSVLQNTHTYALWLHHMVEKNPDTNFFLTEETTDLGDGVNHRELLKKYLFHVAEYEGTNFMSKRESYPGMPIFTDEEWAELERIDAEPRPKERVVRDYASDAALAELRRKLTGG